MRPGRWLPLLLALEVSLPGSPRRAAGEEATDPASGAIRFYQRHLSAMRHFHCRFAPSCSQYAQDAIARHGLVQGSALAADRLMRCNSSAETRYARDREGLLVDPVGGGPASASAVRTPGWLVPDAEPDGIPTAAGLDPSRRVRLEETVAFAHVLERRGDCERASAEYQRAGTLADTAAADAWAYARIGQCYLRSSDWVLADRAFLIAAMLTVDRDRRAEIGFAAAVSRFDAGAFVACSDLIADSALAETARPRYAAASFDGRGLTAAPVGRVATLAGMCAFARGEWAVAQRHFEYVERTTPDEAFRARVRTLSASTERGPRLPHRSPAIAGTLSAIVPGAGQAYTGHVRDGVRHLLFNAALIYTVASLASHEQVPAAVIAGSVTLPFYVGGILGARASAERFDHGQRMRLLGEAITESSR